MTPQLWNLNIMLARLCAAGLAWLAATMAYAQTYTGVTWGLDRSSSPYKIGINLSGTWYNFAQITSAGVPTPYFPGTTCAASQWFNAVSTLGAFTCAQPDATNVTFTATGAGAVARTVAQVLDNIVLADNFGAVGDGTTDDRAAISAAATALGSNGGTVLLSCGKNYRIATNLTIPANVTLKHCRGYGGNPGIDWTTGPIASQPHIKLDGTASIIRSSNSGFDGVIIRTGLTPPVADASSYTGTAMKLAVGGANDVRTNALIVGFAICYDGTNGGDRYDLNIECDGNPSATSGAVIIGASLDSARARIRTYPWGTVAHATPTNTRTGYGTQILAGNQDDSRLDIMDFGHAKGIVSSANGNIHFTHIWTDNNSSYGVQFDAGDRITIDAAFVYASLGVRFNNVGTYSIGYLLVDTGSVASADAIGIAAAANLHIGKLDVKKASAWGLNIGSLSAYVRIDSASFANVNGGTAPYIVGQAGWSSDQVSIGAVNTDLVSGSSLLGGNPVTIKQIASAATMALPVTGDVFSVTGTAAINTITGTWGGREISLLFESTASLTTAGNITLMNSATLQGAAGVVVDLIYDHVAAKWREKGRNLGSAALENTGTSGHTIPFLDGANSWGQPQTFSAAPMITGITIASLPACNSGTRGTLVWIDDTVSAGAPTFHGTVSTGGSTTVHSLASCNGTVWVWD